MSERIIRQYVQVDRAIGSSRRRWVNVDESEAVVRKVKRKCTRESGDGEEFEV